MKARYYGYCPVVPGRKLIASRWFDSSAGHIVLLEFVDQHGVTWIGPEFPRTLIARTRYQNYQVRFLQTVAAPEDLLKNINFGDVGEGILEAFSQWRIDFPIRESACTLDEGQRQIISSQC